MALTKSLNGVMLRKGTDGSGIPPGDTLEYRPNLADQVGTYWFHTHILGQYPDGLRTPFIIVDPESPFSYDSETSITVSDWVLISIKSDSSMTIP
jgi:FtsP/CotA-like multicopper oxidase with cupredoxin domain